MGSTRPDIDWGTTHPGDRYPQGDRYPTSPIPGAPNYGPYDRYNPDPYGNDRDRDKYGPMMPGAGGYDRDRDRYPVMPGDRDRYPMMPGDRDRDRYGPMMPADRDRYPMMPADRDRDRYGPMMPGDRDRYGQMMPVGGYIPGGDRYPQMGVDRYPPSPMGPERYPVMRPGENYPPQSGYDRYPPMRPDDRYPPAPARPPTTDAIDTKYPPPPAVNSNRYPDDRYAGPKDRYNPDDPRNPNIAMYPDTRHPPNRGQQPVERPYVPVDRPYSPAERPYSPVDPMYSVRYPENMPPPSSMMGPYGRYPASENRFPVGNDRFPINIYKYGNRPMYMQPSGMMGGSYPYEMDNRGYQQPPIRPIGGARPPYLMVGYGDMDNGVSDMFGMPYGQGRPPITSGTRCDEQDSYKQMGLRQKMKNQFIRRKLKAQNLVYCQRQCSDAKDFVCRSFNYRDDGERTAQQGVESFNCELSDRDLRELDLNNPQMFENANYDFYERSIGGRSNDGECLDVSQVCNEDGMEFTLRTSEPFAGRIYSYGFYDR